MFKQTLPMAADCTIGTCRLELARAVALSAVHAYAVMADETQTSDKTRQLKFRNRMFHLAPMPIGEVHDVLRTAGLAEECELLTVHQGTAP